MPQPVSFVAFFLAWAEFKGWRVPDCHVLAADWLEKRGLLAVLMAFRGIGKSTLLGCYNAWRIWQDPTYRILHQGDQDKTAYKTSVDTKAVLQYHPWVRMAPRDIAGEITFWSVAGNTDPRNPSMQAAGITSNITSSRADEVQNDDVEVPRNIQTAEAREKMRYRLGEQTHILVPGGRKLYVGTPHTHDSLYEEQIAKGSDVLRIPLFAREQRWEVQGVRTFTCRFRPDVVFVGIGKGSTVAEPAIRQVGSGWAIEFDTPPGGVVDAYAGNAWPERFTTGELLVRRRDCRTLNEWDSQYQLHAKPIHQVRLDPDWLQPYEVEPEVVVRNKAVAMFLGRARIVSATLRMDPSSGKRDSDVCALALILTDEAGNSYWHRAMALEGALADFDERGQMQPSGQVMAICDVVRDFQLPCVDVETNGIGGHVPAVLRAALRSRGLQCTVREVDSRANKQARILAAIEPPLKSGTLWAHVSVLGAVADQMRGWNPMATNQPDDYLDAAAGALEAEPVRIGKVVHATEPHQRKDWRAGNGTIEYGVAA